MDEMLKEADVNGDGRIDVRLASFIVCLVSA
jgi:hypothetical protein